ncbi:sugar ABC transporter substrate-binding protein [Kitasatospora atroaurantiaca]|uniref:Carbohydrate ABC transporter substrate-binding protein (CUT1 family) n=1 Tax=Kitasatospora atroaurantiaca TaxID=285545 RepID=A0A561EI02_9ACTN|nr:sugar ABC transporter substrate-binding protein [Kitasatospora atroaurantiaca]TWE15246.1 carbohydrate ABC transporter substrate-binding protein (CUT1 family) [Kitasatospora atroaurantiaca]
MSTPRTSGRRAVRLTAALTASALSASLLAACGSSGSSDAAPASDGRPVTITFWAWAKGTKEVVDAFNASHKDVQVKFEQIPSGVAGGYAKISDASKAGNAPDLFNVEYAALPDFVSQGAVQDITKVVSADLKAKYLPQAVQLTTLAKSTWAIPLDAAPQAFFYRKDLFEKAGITTPPKTWDEYRDDALKLKAADPNTRIGTFLPDDPSTFAALSWQAGAHWFTGLDDTWNVDINSTQTKRVTDYWQKLVSDDLVRLQPSFSQQWTASLQKGETAGYLGAAWGGGVLKSTLAGSPDSFGKWAVAPIPTWDGRPASGMLGGSTFAVSKNSKKAKAAVEFATWATTTPEGIQARIASGTSSMFPADPDLIPTAKAAFKTDFYGGQDIYAVFTDASKSIKQDWQWGPAMGITNNSMKDIFGKLNQGGTIQAAVEAAQQGTVAELKNRGLKVAQ